MILEDIINIYLPIAGLRMNVIYLIILGGCAGVLSGMLGIGGGLVMVPSLIFIGIPSNIVISSVATAMVATTSSGFIAYSVKKRIDYKLGILMTVGGLSGCTVGVYILDTLTEMGKVDIFVALSFSIILTAVALIALRDTIRILYYRYKKMERPKSKGLFRGKVLLPYRVSIISSKNSASVISLLIVGAAGGILVSVLGIGGGLIMVPIMIHMFKISVHYVPGTTHFTLLFITIFVTLLNSLTANNYDLILLIPLVLGNIFGVQFGVRVGTKFQPDNLRLVLAIVILLLCLRVSLNLYYEPSDIFTIVEYR